MRRVNACPHPHASLTPVASLITTPTHLHTDTHSGTVGGWAHSTALLCWHQHHVIWLCSAQGRRREARCECVCRWCHVTVQWLPTSHRTEVQHNTTQVVLWCGAPSSAMLYSRYVGVISQACSIGCHTHTSCTCTSHHSSPTPRSGESWTICSSTFRQALVTSTSLSASPCPSLLLLS